MHPQIDQLEAFGPVFFPYHSGFPFYFSKALNFLAPRLVQCQLSTFARSQDRDRLPVAAMRPIASRIAVSSEHSGSLHAIGYAYEPLRLILCEFGPVQLYLSQHRRSNIRYRPSSPNILRGMGQDSGRLSRGSAAEIT